MPKSKKTHKIHFLKKSNIRNAGIGAFANQELKKGALLGEYKGSYVSKEQFERLRNTDYVFQVNKQGRLHHYINGCIGNWITRINGAKTKLQAQKINIECYQYGQKIYYRTTKNIKRGDEFIIYYGDEYWI